MTHSQGDAYGKLSTSLFREKWKTETLKRAQKAYDTLNDMREMVSKEVRGRIEATLQSYDKVRKKELNSTRIRAYACAMREMERFVESQGSSKVLIRSRTSSPKKAASTKRSRRPSILKAAAKSSTASPSNSYQEPAAKRVRANR